MFETPHYVSELYMKKEDLRILRENVLLVVRDYNRFVLMMNSMANIGFGVKCLTVLQYLILWHEILACLIARYSNV